MYEFESIRNSVFKQLSSILIILLPILLYFIPIEWMNNQPSICLFKNIFGFDCYGCGITRAIICGVQLNFKSAIEYNQMIVLVFPILIYIWIRTAISLIKSTKTTHFTKLPLRH